MDNPFKVGDRVRRLTQGIGGRMVKGQDYTVSCTFADHDIMVEGDTGVWNSSNFELAPPAVKTDEELAAEYRELRNKAKEIATELRNRGYESQSKSKSNGGLWGTMTQAPHQYRFVKNLTKEI